MTGLRDLLALLRLHRNNDKIFNMFGIYVAKNTSINGGANGPALYDKWSCYNSR